MSVEVKPDLTRVHYIRRWSGIAQDERPICGAGPFLKRTLIGNTHDSAGEPMNICEDCKRMASPIIPDTLPRNSCNRHVDCEMAVQVWLERYPGKTRRDLPVSFHCHDDECEDCFGG
jgi:hypothetical protein